MRVMEDLQVTQIKLEGHNLPVPAGFSDLLNDSKVWVLKQEGGINEDSKLLSKYERKVSLEDGKLRTYLTYAG